MPVTGYEITEKGRAMLAATIADSTIPPTPGLSAAYLCQTPGCTEGTCNYCVYLRGWGARRVCNSCGAPLELWPDQFKTQPLCGQCAGPFISGT